MSWYSNFLIYFTITGFVLCSVKMLFGDPELKPIGHPLVVVHVDSVWEGAERVAEGVGILLKEYRTVYLLVDNENWEKTTLLDFEPTEVVIAPGGEWIGVRTHVAVLVGGYMRTCFKNAARAVVRQNKEVLLVLHMRYVYHNSKETLFEYYQSEWGEDKEGFLNYMNVCAKEFGFENPVVTMESEMIMIEEK